jgi:hypothetical protein
MCPCWRRWGCRQLLSCRGWIRISHR